MNAFKLNKIKRTLNQKKKHTIENTYKSFPYLKQNNLEPHLNIFTHIGNVNTLGGKMYINTNSTTTTPGNIYTIKIYIRSVVPSPQLTHGLLLWLRVRKIVSFFPSFPFWVNISTASCVVCRDEDARVETLF